jgi:5'-methylthioadenosine phosphorylase
MTNHKPSKPIKLAIIGGTGVYDPQLLQNTRQVKIATPYGMPSDAITVGEYENVEIAFLPRHGGDHRIPPHMVPYRANIWALKELGVERIIAPCAVGSLREEIPPGDLVITDQFVDFTKNRQYSFYDGGLVYHIAVNNPFCQELRQLALIEAKKLNIKTHDRGTLVCIHGPRYSTKAESNFFRNAVKADIIGMTTVPECILARELEICYVSIAASTDYDSWHEEPVNAAMVVRVMAENTKNIRTLIKAMIPNIPAERSGEKCDCPIALQNATH